MVAEMALAAGASAAVQANHWAQGGRGAINLGNAVVKACEIGPNDVNRFKFLYPLDFDIKAKIHKVSILMTIFCLFCGIKSFSCLSNISGMHLYIWCRQRGVYP